MWVDPFTYRGNTEDTLGCSNVLNVQSTDTVTLRWLMGAQKDKSGRGSQRVGEMVRKQEKC